MVSKIKHTAAAIAVAGALGMASGSAFATLDANVGTALNINTFDVDLGGGDTFNDINQFNWTGWILSDFGAGGAPSITNSVFTDYIVLNLQTATTSGGGTQGVPVGKEVTAVVQATGIVTNGVTGEFRFTGISMFDVFLDSGVIGADAVLNFGEYFDGTNVLNSGGLVSLTTAPAPDPNTGILSPTVGAGGSVNFQNQLLETAVDFLLTADGSQSLFDAAAPDQIAALTESQLTFQALQVANGGTTCAGDGNCADTETPIINNFINQFGIADPGTLTLTLVQSSPTTNIASYEVPAPAALGLLGAGFLGMAGVRRRRKA